MRPRPARLTGAAGTAHAPHVPRRAHGGPMHPALGLAVQACSTLLWLSGGAWLTLHYFFASPGDFGSTPNSAEPTLLTVHGWIAVASVFLLGWVTAAHVVPRWATGPRRPSGITLAAVAAVLTVTGYALYYTTDTLHGVAAAIHEIIGVVALVAALAHWLKRASQ